LQSFGLFFWGEFTMAVVRIAHEVSGESLLRIEALIERTLNYDVNWNGATIDIERGDFTCLVCNDKVAGAQLLSKVFAVIDGQV
jgi:hypothetical protein